LPARIELPLGHLLGDEDITGVARITEMLVASLSRTMLNVAIAKIALEHGNARVAPPMPSEPQQAA
jgi:hypothetical protein